MSTPSLTSMEDAMRAALEAREISIDPHEAAVQEVAGIFAIEVARFTDRGLDGAWILALAVNCAASIIMQAAANVEAAPGVSKGDVELELLEHIARSVALGEHFESFEVEDKSLQGGRA